MIRQILNKSRHLSNLAIKLPARLLGKIDITIIYTTRVGIKCINKPVNSDHFTHFAVGKPFQIPINELHLPRDDLRDQYTLIGVPVARSPHSELVALISQRRDFMDCEYARRFQRGTLDPRGRNILDPEKILLGFEIQSEKIMNSEYDPIKVVNDGDRYYIVDGKHRAAVCHYYGVVPECIDVSPLQFDSFYLAVYRKMLKTPDSYKKHIDYFDRILGL